MSKAKLTATFFCISGTTTEHRFNRIQNRRGTRHSLSVREKLVFDRLQPQNNHQNENKKFNQKKRENLRQNLNKNFNQKKT